MTRPAANGVNYALGRLHHGETQLATALITVSERHHAEHEIHHVTRDLARLSETNLEHIAAVAADHGLQVERNADQPRPFAPTGTEAVNVAGQPAPALTLLEDLRTLYLMASANSLSWEMLAQLAQATQRRDLLELASRCHPQTLRQLRWANTMIKTVAPQALTSL